MIRGLLRRAVPPPSDVEVGAGEHDPTKQAASSKVHDALRRIEQLEREAKLVGHRSPPRPEPQ